MISHVKKCDLQNHVQKYIRIMHKCYITHVTKNNLLIKHSIKYSKHKIILNSFKCFLVNNNNNNKKI